MKSAMDIDNYRGKRFQSKDSVSKNKDDAEEVNANKVFEQSEIKFTFEEVDHVSLPISDSEIKNFKERKNTPRHFNSNKTANTNQSKMGNTLYFSKVSKNHDAEKINPKAISKNNLVPFLSYGNSKSHNTSKEKNSIKEVLLKEASTGSHSLNDNIDLKSSPIVTIKDNTKKPKKLEVIKTSNNIFAKCKSNNNNKNLEGMIEDCLKRGDKFEDAYKKLIENDLIEEVYDK